MEPKMDDKTFTDKPETLEESEAQLWLSVIQNNTTDPELRLRLLMDPPESCKNDKNFLFYYDKAFDETLRTFQEQDMKVEAAIEQIARENVADAALQVASEMDGKPSQTIPNVMAAIQIKLQKAQASLPSNLAQKKSGLAATVTASNPKTSLRGAKDAEKLLAQKEAEVQAQVKKELEIKAEAAEKAEAAANAKAADEKKDASLTTKTENLVVDAALVGTATAAVVGTATMVGAAAVLPPPARKDMRAESEEETSEKKEENTPPLPKPRGLASLRNSPVLRHAHEYVADKINKITRRLEAARQAKIWNNPYLEGVDARPTPLKTH
jgi:hypothetical protein